MSVPEHPIAAKLEAARRELLDLSLRNPLLNYRPLKSRGVEVVNELPAEIFRILVKEGKAMSFLPIDSKTALSLIEQPVTPNAPFIPTPAQTDNKLQTKETLEKLQGRLLDTYHSARMFVEEQGVNILYLVLGSLTWYETENSAEGRQAPLILVPVELERTTAREQFQMRYTGGEIGSNLSLQARLKTDFGIALPDLPEAEELDVIHYFDEVWLRVVGRKGWVINAQTISLGFFSFGKFMMYNDLDSLTWPDTAQPGQHPILNALLQEQGFREPASHIPDEAHLDEYVTPAETRQVVDADSSQTLAILDVNQGRNLVIQGPPGTGKSQTITNLIAEAIGKGKTVLFVAEKMAALEVVKRRLDKVGLGEACLELHSHKTNKKDLLRELQRTLEVGKPQLPALEGEVNLLTQIRARLNDYATAINTPVGTSNLTMYVIYGRLIQQRKKYAGVELPRLALPSLLAWSQPEFKAKEALIEEVQARLSQMGMPKKLLFWGSQRRSLLPTEQNSLQAQLVAANQAAPTLRSASEQLARLMQMTPPANRRAADQLSQISQQLQQSPDYRGINLVATVWSQKQAELRSLIAAGTAFAKIHQQYDSGLISEAWGHQVLPIRQNLLAYGEKWWRFAAGAYRKSKNELTGLTRLGLPKENRDQLALVDAILEEQRQAQILKQGQELGQAAFGRQWRGKDSDWHYLHTLLNWVVNLYQDVQTGRVPMPIFDWLAQEPDLSKLPAPSQALEAALNEQEETITALKQLLQWEDEPRFGPENTLLNLDFEKQAALLQARQSRPEELHQVVAWNILADRLQDAGLQEIINLVLNWPEA
ncbi:MAG: DNA helicase, partial [Cytophagales bacterium CG18_big_fil_WC_8_21_14_2_50_42_9]